MARSRATSTRKEPRIVEGIDPSDDEEIDEDEAFNSEDELMFGDAFLGAKKKKKKKQKKSTSAEATKKKSKGRGTRDDGDSVSDDSSDESGDGSAEDEDSEDDGSDDWAGSSGSDDDDADGDDDDGGQYMLDLLNNLDKQVTPSSSAGRGDTADGSGGRSRDGGGGKIALGTVAAEAAVRLPESAFRAGALSALSPAAAGPLTLDSLMGGIADTADFAAVQTSMRVLAGGAAGGGPPPATSPGAGAPASRRLATAAVPVSRVVSARASRKVHAAAASQEVSRWQDAVHEQRDAETLDFRTNKNGGKANRVTRETLVETFAATTDFERELQGALEAAGMEDEGEMRRKERRRLTGRDGDDEDAEGAEEAADGDDLGAGRLTPAEYRQRHGELAKLRALMFHEEQKRHRINKIKSKKYRKIRKRKQDRLRDAEGESEALGEDGGAAAERERAEKEEMARMEERMTLAHRNTSKWAKHVLRRGSKMDVDERRALSLQIAKGDELRRKALGADDGEEESEGETEEGLLRQARRILAEDDADEEDGETEGKKKGLFQLDFMKRGMEAQRTRAKEEARQLLEELEANERAAVSSDDDDEDAGARTPVKKKPRTATEAETRAVLPEGALVASALRFGKADGFAVRVDGNIALDGGGEEPPGPAAAGGEEAAAEGAKKKRRKKKKGAKDAAAATTAPAATARAGATAAPEARAGAGEEENPWLAARDGAGTGRRTPAPAAVNIGRAAALLDAGEARAGSARDGPAAKREREPRREGAAPAAAGAEEDAAPGVLDLSQAELVRRAFAAPADLAAAEEEFQKEKETMKERDDPTRKKKEDKWVSGWGSWAGAGAPPPRPRPKLPPKLRPPASKKGAAATSAKRKDDGLSTVIINEKRLKKTSRFQLAQIPYPYRSREEYERAVAGSIGAEWNTLQGTKEMSRPAVLVRAGKIIQPIGTEAKLKKAKGKQNRRAPAKF